jgi:hypothetical protein
MPESDNCVYSTVVAFAIPAYQWPRRASPIHSAAAA